MVVAEPLFLRWVVVNGQIRDQFTGVAAYVADSVNGGELKLDTTPTRTTGTASPVQCALQRGQSQPPRPLCFNSNGDRFQWYTIGDNAANDGLYLGLEVPAGGNQKDVQFRASCAPGQAFSGNNACFPTNYDPLNGQEDPNSDGSLS